MMKEVSTIVFHNSTFRLRRVLLLSSSSAIRQLLLLDNDRSCCDSWAADPQVHKDFMLTAVTVILTWRIFLLPVQLDYGHQRKRTRVMPKDLDPTWNEKVRELIRYWWCSSWISTVLARSSAAVVSRNACNVEVSTLQQFCLRLERRVSGVMIVFISCK